VVRRCVHKFLPGTRLCVTQNLTIAIESMGEIAVNIAVKPPCAFRPGQTLGPLPQIPPRRKKNTATGLVVFPRGGQFILTLLRAGIAGRVVAHREGPDSDGLENTYRAVAAFQNHSETAAGLA